MLFSTVLGLVLPISMKTGSYPGMDVSAKADDVSETDTKNQTIKSASDKVDQVFAALEMNATVNLPETEADTETALKTAFDTNVENLKAKKIFETNTSNYTNGSIDESTFLSYVNSYLSDQVDGGVPLPIEWESSAQFLAKIYELRNQKISDAGLADNAKAVKVASATQPYTDPVYLSGKAATRAKIITSIAGTTYNYIVNGIDGEKISSTTKPDARQLSDAQTFLEGIVNVRKTVINSLKSVSDKSKSDAIAEINTAMEADQAKISAVQTSGELGTLVKGFASEYFNIMPVSDVNVASDATKAAALATLDTNYKQTLDTLSAIKGYDADVKVAKAKADSLYAQYKEQISSAVTSSDLSTITGKSFTELNATTELMATDAEKTVGINAINAAVTAQIATINADTQASDTEKTTAITTINNTANQYIPLIKAANTTVQVLKTAQDAAISTIKAVTAMHNQLATTAQRNTAMNAVIIAGNTKKVAIQNDTSIAAADKTMAYAAVDKLVTSYTDQMKAAKLLATDLAKIQSDGVAAVTAYQATKTVAATATSETTTSDANATSTSKASAKKVLYAISGLKLYKSDTLKGKTVASYAKHKRTDRPTFLVTKTVKNDAGKKVYYVQNQASGKKGYITSSTKSVAYAYYQTTPKKVQIISKAGVNQYKKANLSAKQKHYKKGQTLKVKKLIKSGVTTRFQLTNGSYISANKKFVIDTQY